MALLPNQPGLTTANRLLTSQPAGNRPPSFNKFRMSGEVADQSAASPPHTGQSAAYPAAYYSAHPELVAGWPRAEGGTAAEAGPQAFPVEPTTYREGGV